MPASSKSQLRYVYAMRNKYKNKKNAPKHMKWVFGKEWTEDVKLNDLPNRVMNFKSFTESLNFFNKKVDSTITLEDLKSSKYYHLLSQNSFLTGYISFLNRILLNANSIIKEKLPNEINKKDKLVIIDELVLFGRRIFNNYDYLPTETQYNIEFKHFLIDGLENIYLKY